MKKALYLVLLLTLSVSLYAETEADKICGVYYVIDKFTSGEHCKVRIYRTKNDTYNAQVIWMQKPNHPDGTRRLDVNNPNPALRSTPCDQVIMMRGLTYNAAEKEWQNGEVYNPQNGRFYKAYMSFEDDKTLRVRGYWGIAMLGATMYWTKLE